MQHAQDLTRVPDKIAVCPQPDEVVVVQLLHEISEEGKLEAGGGLVELGHGMANGLLDGLV